MINAGYKKWLVQVGKDSAGITTLLMAQLGKRNKLAWMLMKEANATFNISGVQTAVEFLLKQIKSHGKKTESTKD